MAASFPYAPREAAAIYADNDPTVWQQAIISFERLHVLEAAVRHSKTQATHSKRHLLTFMIIVYSALTFTSFTLCVLFEIISSKMDVEYMTPS